MSFELEAVMVDSDPLKKRANSFKKPASVRSRVKVKMLPDLGSHGGRKFSCLHLGGRLQVLNEAAFKEIILKRWMELRKLRDGNQIR